MERTRWGRTALGLLAAALAVSGGLLATTAGHPGRTTEATNRVNNVHIHVTRIHGVPPAHVRSAHAAEQPGTDRIVLTDENVNCPVSQTFCDYTTGMVTYNDGSCQADTTVDYWRGSNTVDVSITEYSPYWFAGCTVWSRLYFGSTTGNEYAGNSFYGYACSATDPTCSNTQTWKYNDQPSGVPLADAPSLQSIWVVDTA
jgi:hypothetical protein